MSMRANLIKRLEKNIHLETDGDIFGMEQLEVVLHVLFAADNGIAVSAFLAHILGKQEFLVVQLVRLLPVLVDEFESVSHEVAILAAVRSRP